MTKVDNSAGHQPRSLRSGQRWTSSCNSVQLSPLWPIGTDSRPAKHRPIRPNPWCTGNAVPLRTTLDYRRRAPLRTSNDQSMPLSSGGPMCQRRRTTPTVDRLYTNDVVQQRLPNVNNHRPTTIRRELIRGPDLYTTGRDEVVQCDAGQRWATMVNNVKYVLNRSATPTHTGLNHRQRHRPTNDRRPTTDRQTTDDRPAEHSENSQPRDIFQPRDHFWTTFGTGSGPIWLPIRE